MIKEILMQEISKVLANSSTIAEEKLAVMMMFSFQLLSAAQADMINMRVADGRVLTLKLESGNLTL
ncbi:hypothetical protein [Xenorhabdus miraniensis]|uniref:Uncharacterized protein n=1 Tax=Xenorhabdus miraniensis TaxID=351674 RepID=A0A2D0JWX9_9GAMM|nr:hypothetical protein [Xenorhabdus miraniensis]PHM50863.1 hypothetical protein Xmir_00273 [Xenorhabdus miraniensis]